LNVEICDRCRVSYGDVCRQLGAADESCGVDCNAARVGSSCDEPLSFSPVLEPLSRDFDVKVNGPLFGSHRIAWGSNFPANAGPLAALLCEATESLRCLSAEDQEWIFAKTAQTLYPVLANSIVPAAV